MGQSHHIINDHKTSLIDEDACFLERNIKFDDTSYKTIQSVADPDLDELSDSEISIVDKVIQQYGKINTNELIDITHEEPGWNQIPQNNDVMVEHFLMGIDENRATMIKEKIRSEKESNRVLYSFL